MNSLTLTNITIGGEFIISPFESYFNADYRRFSWVRDGAEMVEVMKDGNLIDWGVFRWK